MLLRLRRNGYRRVGVCACKTFERLIRKVLCPFDELPGNTDLTSLQREACRALLDQIDEDLVWHHTK